MQFEDIKTDRLLIREYSDQYLEQLFEYRSDPRVYLWYTKKQNSIEDLKEYLKSNITEFDKDNGYSVFVILLEDKVIGDIAISYWDYDNERSALGYAIRPEYQRLGYGYEAVNALINFMFEVMKQNRIQAGVDYNNKASIGLLRKLGFRREGYFRQTEYKNGEWKDSCLYAILREDWVKNRSKEQK